MRTKKAVQKSKSGGVMLMTLLVMLAFSILAIGLYQMSATNAVEAVYHDHSNQAFWLAESGLQDAIQRLRYDAVFRDTAADGSESFSVTNAVTGTGYDVTVSYLDGTRFLEYYRFNVVSVGWKSGMNRRIRQYVSTRPGFISAIMAPNNINVAANTIVSGPIMVLDDGELTLEDKNNKDLPGDLDTVILSDDASMDPRSNAKEPADYAVLDLAVPDSIPQMPNFSKYLNEANLQPEVYDPGDPAYPITNLVINVTGNTYTNCPAGLVAYKIIGNGRLVNTGDITIIGDVNAAGDVSSDVSIFSFGDLRIEKKTDFGNNILLYGFNTVYFGDGSYCPGNSAILADGGTFGAGIAEDNDDIVMGGQSEFYGVVFADEGDVDIQPGSGGDANTRIVGTVISGNSVDMNSNSEIIFDPSVFYDSDEFDLLSVFQTEVTASKGDWRELPPL
jgi:hypothetical protein